MTYRNLFTALLFVLIPTLAVAEEVSCFSSFRDQLSEYLVTAHKVQKEKNAQDQEDQTSELFEMGLKISKTFLECNSESERLKMESDLGASIRGHQSLEKLWIPLGQSFVTTADALITARQAKLQKYRLIGAGILGTLGLAVGGGFIALKFIPSTPGGVITALAAGGLLGAGSGYFLLGPALGAMRLPADPLAANAKDFLVRYPQGLDFLKDVSSIDLALEADDLNER